MTDNRPVCPLCDRLLSFSHSLKSGAIAYRCRRGCFTSEGDAILITIGDISKPVAKSQKQRDADWKQRDPIGYAESQKRRQERLKQRDPVAYAENNRLRQARYRAKKKTL